MSRIYLSVKDETFAKMLRVELSSKGAEVTDLTGDVTPPCAVVCSPDSIPEGLSGKDDVTLIAVGYEDEFSSAEVPPAAIVTYRPFDTDEFLATVFSCDGEQTLSIRKRSPTERMTLDPATRTVSLGTGKVKLTKREFSLFEYLYSRRGETLTRGEIYRDVWGGGDDENVVDVYVCYLRGKLSRAFGINILQTSRGKGYSFDK